MDAGWQVDEPTGLLVSAHEAHARRRWDEADRFAAAVVGGGADDWQLTAGS